MSDKNTTELRLTQNHPVAELLSPALLFLLALSVRLLVVARWHFDGLYGQDSFVYFQQAVAIAENLPRGQLPPAGFFWPDGYPLLVALFFRLLGQSAPVAQLVGLLCGAALAPLAYALAGALFPQTGRRAGVVAGLIFATAGQVILSSVVIMADIPALFWAMLAAWLLTHTWHRPPAGRRSVWLLGVGIALALAIISRWIYALLLPAFAVYLLYQMRQHRDGWWMLLLPAVGGAVIFLPQLWLSLHHPEGLLHDWLLGWRPGNAFQRQFENVDGYFFYRLPVGLFYAQPAGHPAYLFPLLGLTALLGIYRLLARRAWLPVILLLGWSGPVYLFLAGIPYENFRFGLTLYPPLALLAGYGVSELWERARWRRFIQAATLLSLAGMLAWAFPVLDEFLTAQNNSKAIVHRVDEIVPPDATLLAFGLTLTLQHYTSRHTLELYVLDPVALDALTRREPNLYLLVDPINIERQWLGRPPERNYRWLREHATLTPIGTFSPYQLYRVQRSDVIQQERGAFDAHRPDPPRF
jgi:4-amino-4-deoxy-L-arabinose transferase-like glycosyltransferase